jgi:flagellar secretion chaperone FliS
MAYNRSSYLNQEILNASPEKLVQTLYHLVTSSIASARECIRKEDIPGRVRHINKAFEALVELTNGLDYSASKEIAANYESIYAYCRKRLVDANTSASDEILAEVAKLMQDLQDAWDVVVERTAAENAARFADEELLASEKAIAGRLDVIG